MATQRATDGARRAIRALLNGEAAADVSRYTCGTWWTVVAGLHVAGARGGPELVRQMCRKLLEAHADLAALFAGLPLAEPSAPIAAADLLALGGSHLRWAVPQLVPEGLTILAGAPKLGKSWLCLELAMAVATGGVALGSVQVEQGDVLYLALEESQRRLQERLGHLLGSHPSPEGLSFTASDQNVPRWDQGGKWHIERWLDKHAQARMVIVDTLAKFRPRQRAGRGIYEQDYESMQGLLALARERRIAVLVVHHINKSAPTDALQQVSGSFGLTGGVDGALVLQRERGQREATLSVIGRDVEEQEFTLLWEGSSRRWTLAGQAAEYKMSKARQVILQVLRSDGRAMTPKEVWETLELVDPHASRNAVRQMMYQLAKQGLLQVADGKYVVLEVEGEERAKASRVDAS